MSKATRVLIVDDEPFARRGLREELTQIPGVACVGECADADAAVSAIVDRRPDVVLLDVQLASATAFDIIEAIGIDQMPLVIFVTAYDRHAIKAFEVHAVDYVLKPVDPKRLREAIGRAQRQTQLERGASVVERLEHLLTERQVDAGAPRSAGAGCARLVVRDGDELRFVDAKQLEWVESAGNYVRLHCAAASAAAPPPTYTIRTTMERMARRLAGDGPFIRVRQSALINVRAVVSIQRYSKGMFLIRLRSGCQVISSRYHQAELRKYTRPERS